MTRPMLTIVFALAGAAPLAAQGTASTPPEVVSYGDAIIRVPADHATISVSTESHGDTAPDAQARGNAAMRSVQDAVAALKIKGIQVTTTGLYLSPDYIYRNNERIMKGFVGRHTITIQLDDVARAGEVLGAAVSAGATNVNGIAFSRRDRQALEQQALKQAVQVARARADAIAAGAGSAVVRIVRVSEQWGGPQAPIRVGGNLGGAAESLSVAPPPVAVGEVEVRAFVTLTAAIK